MACIGQDKLTRERIRAGGVFSANLVTEALLPLADYYGNVPGYDPDKMKVVVETTKGQVLPVPVLVDSPWSYELEVDTTIHRGEGEVYLCRIRNVLAANELLDTTRSVEERLQSIAPVRTTCGTYFSFAGRDMGSWGEPQSAVLKPTE